MMRKDDSQSKIIVPHVCHQLLSRKKIAAVIDNAYLDEAICLVAPYGCGKTLAVVSWLHERGQTAAWMTLDEADNSEWTFFTSLSAAIMRLSGWQGNAGDILAEPRYAEDPRDFLWNAISRVEKSGCDQNLVIDGFRFIRDPALLRSVKEIISSLLGRWRVIVISRTELPSVFNDLILRAYP